MRIRTCGRQRQQQDVVCSRTPFVLLLLALNPPLWTTKLIPCGGCDAFLFGRTALPRRRAQCVVVSRPSRTTFVVPVGGPPRNYPSSSSLGNALPTVVENELYDNVDLEGENRIDEDVDVAIVGAGIGGLCAGAILNTLYGKRVGVYESHYLPGGCAHAFDRVAAVAGKGGANGEEDATTEKIRFTFDSGPTIVLGCSRPPYNPLRQVLNAVGLGDAVEWIRYGGWGMIENLDDDAAHRPLRWKLDLGPDVFEEGPLNVFGGPDALREFRELREATMPLVSGAVDIPAMAMRSGSLSLVPLLRYFSTLMSFAKQGTEALTGTFEPFLNGPLYTVTDPWLRDWLDALAFSLSGLPANRTAAAAMAYVLFDMHREGAALDYPRGGLGRVIDALVVGVQQGDVGSRVHLRQHVESIDTTPDGTRAVGITLRGGKKIRARDGVICNAPIWSLRGLVANDGAKKLLNDGVVAPTIPDPAPKKPLNSSLPVATTAPEEGLLTRCDTAEMTRSFLHLHLALNATGLDLDSMEAHYTVMDRGLTDDPCGELNMIAVSNPCVLDRDLAPSGYIVVHAYGAGNEPYEMWEGLDRRSNEYDELKEKRAAVLWRAVESIIPDARERAVLDLIGSPVTHERFLRRPRGTYGAATEDYLKDGSTPIKGLVLCGDGVFPGIGVPAVALSGASAANSMVDVFSQWRCMDSLKSKNIL